MGCFSIPRRIRNAEAAERRAREEQVARAIRIARERPQLKVVIVGGRHYLNYRAVENALRFLHDRRGIREAICTGATGAEMIAMQWGSDHAVLVYSLPAEPKLYKQDAERVRNGEMFEICPNGLVAFPGGARTRGIIAQAAKCGLPIWQPYAFRKAPYEV